MNPCLRNFLIFLRFFSCKWAFTIRVHCFMVPWSTCLYHYVPHYPIPFLIITQSQWTATHLCPSRNRFTSVKTCFKKAVFVECSQANPNIFGCRKFSGFDQRLWTQPRLFLDASLLNAGQVARLGTTRRGWFGRDGDADDDYMGLYVSHMLHV